MLSLSARQPRASPNGAMPVKDREKGARPPSDQPLTPRPPPLLRTMTVAAHCGPPTCIHYYTQFLQKFFQYFPVKNHIFWIKIKHHILRLN